MKRNRKKTIIIASIVGFILLILILPIRFPNSIGTPAKLLPARFWILQRFNDGSLTATFVDQLKNGIQSYSAYQIERGDVLNFRISDNLTNKRQVSLGDTIGYIQSSLTDQQISRLRGELESAHAMLNVNLTGEKETVIKEAEDRLRLSREKAELQKKILTRQKDLFEKNLISKETYEIAAGTARIFELEAEMAQAQQEALETGAKPENIAFYKSEILSKQRELQVLNERKKQFIMISPLSGNIYQSFSNDTLIVIADTLCTVLIAVPQRYKAEIQAGQAFSLKMMTYGDKHIGRIIKINPMVQILNESQYMMCIGVLDELVEEIPFNMVVSCDIEAEPKTLFDYLIRLLSSLFI